MQAFQENQFQQEEKKPPHHQQTLVIINVHVSKDYHSFYKQTRFETKRIPKQIVA